MILSSVLAKISYGLIQHYIIIILIANFVLLCARYCSKLLCTLSYLLLPQLHGVDNIILLTEEETELQRSLTTCSQSYC